MLASAADEPLWLHLLDNAFALTLLFVFLAAVAVTLIRRYRRDACLTLLDGFHATLADGSGRGIWGDLVVVPRALEVRFDAPRRARSGLLQSSALIHEDILRAAVGLCRSVDGLSPDERRLREAQLRHSIQPGPARRLLRKLVNFVNALRDALAKAFTLAVEETASSIPGPSALSERTEQIQALGRSLQRAVARAYEPLLERHVGRPVVLRLASAAAPEHPVELPGYLVEYTQDYLAVFNVEHEPFVEHEIEVSCDHRGPGFAVEWLPPRLRIHCTGPEVLIVKEVRTAAGRFELDCALLRGTFAEVGIDDADACVLRLRLTRRVDVVCPRARGTITHGGELDEPVPAAGRRVYARGVAPCEPLHQEG